MLKKRLFAALVSLVVLLALFAAAPVPSGAQQAGQQTAVPSQIPAPVTPATQEFLKAADEVLEEMSRLLLLSIKSPLKKSIRTRDEIRAYVIRRLREEKEPAKWYADQRALEKFGLLPKGFNLEDFLVELLTEQIAGLYDPKSREFFIADWLSVAEQRMVMAHEMAHALHDQHFDLDSWLKAAKPNDDALLARDAVLEGSAIGAMIDYLLREQKVGVRDLPGLEEFIRGQMLADFDKNPQLAKAPLYVRDALLFPYLAGTTFTQRILRANSGWGDFHKVFEDPPISTQQILHPDLYLSRATPLPVALPDLTAALPKGWKKLDDNIVGEFGIHALLKQFLGEERAEKFSPAWAGDRYAIFEHEKTKGTLLIFRLRLASEEDAARFFGAYSDVLEKKHATRRNFLRRPNYLQFSTEEGGVFLRCVAAQCLSVEGIERSAYDRVTRAIGWSPAPRPTTRPAQKPSVTVANLLPHDVSSSTPSQVSH